MCLECHSHHILLARSDPKNSPNSKNSCPQKWMSWRIQLQGAWTGINEELGTFYNWSHWLLHQDGKKSIKKSQTSCLSSIWIVNSSIQLFSATTVSFILRHWVHNLYLCRKEKKLWNEIFNEVLLGKPKFSLALSSLQTWYNISFHRTFIWGLPPTVCHVIGSANLGACWLVAYRVSLIFLQAPQSSDPPAKEPSSPTSQTHVVPSGCVMPAHCHQGHLRHEHRGRMGRCLGLWDQAVLGWCAGLILLALLF